MTLVNNVVNSGKPEETAVPGKEKPGRSKGAPILILLLLLALITGGYWGFVHRDELKEKWFPSESEGTSQVEDGQKDPSTSFFKKLIQRDRTITVRGTLIGEEGGAAVLINKKVLPEGSVINGMRIMEITGQSIVVDSGGQKRRLQVGEIFNPDDN